MGVEAEGRRSFGPLGLRAALSYTQAKVDGGRAAPQLTGLRPAQAPRLSGRVFADWTVDDRLSLSLDLRYESDRFDDDLNSRRLSAATTADLRADWRLTPGAQVFIAADNVLDAPVATGQTADGVYAYGPPRAVRIGLTLRR